MSATDEALSELHGPLHQSAVLDRAHIGDINGAFGTIRHGDHGPRVGWRARVMTLLAILALLWQIYSRCFSSLIQDRQYGHR